MSIIVQRQPADKSGPDIVSSVLTDTESKTEAGRQDINYHGTDKVAKSATVVESDFIRPGRLIAVTRSGIRDTGIVSGFSYARTAVGEAITVTVETLK